MLGKNKPVKARVFEIGYDEPIILPQNKWAAYINFQILGEKERKVHDEKIYTFVCSPEFTKDPPEGEAVDEKTIIMDYLKKDELEARVLKEIQRINNLSVTSWQEYYKELEKNFHIDD